MRNRRDKEDLSFPLNARQGAPIPWRNPVDLIPATDIGVFDIPIRDVLIPERRKTAVNPVTTQRIAESIRTIGQLHPIFITPDNTLIAGLQRIAALRLLNQSTVRAVILPVSGAFAELIAIDENLFRNTITILEQGELILRRNDLLIELGLRAQVGQGRLKKGIVAPIPNPSNQGYEGEGEPGFALRPVRQTTREIACEHNLSERVLQQRAQIVRNIPQDIRDRIRPTNLADCRNELLSLARITDPKEQRSVVEKVLGGQASGIQTAQKMIVREGQKHTFQEQRAVIRRLPDTIKLISGDFIEFSETYLKEGTVDLFLTKAPRVQDFIDEWEPVLSLANSFLKPGGFFVSVCQQTDLPEIFFAAHRNHLEFFWLIGLIHSNAGKLIPARSVTPLMEPIVVLYRPPLRQPHTDFTDVIEKPRQNKSLPVWHQDTVVFSSLLRIFSAPGDLVIDPFLQTGSVACSCYQEMRKCIGFESDEKRVATARERLEQLSHQKQRKTK